MNDPTTPPVVLIGQGAYARAWPTNREPHQDRETLRDLAACPGHSRRSTLMELDTARRALEALLAANERLADDSARAAKAEACAKYEARQTSSELNRLRNLARTQQAELDEARATVARLQKLVDEQIEIIRGLRAAIRHEIAERVNT